jgi:hypothetical protein
VSDSIESVKPILTVIDDEGDLVISSTGPRGKEMAHAVLALANGARKAVVIQDGEMKVLKRGTAAENGIEANGKAPAPPPARRPTSPAPVETGPDIQDSYISDLESGVTGEQAMGEKPSPTPGPSDPVAIPAKKRKPVIYQDAAAPPAPELAEAEMDRLLAEAQQAEADAARVAEDQRFQRQQAVQVQVEPSDVPAEQPAEAARPRRRERQLATTGRPCGRCGGGGKIVGDAGFEGSCPVCHGEGQVKTWDRSLKVR